MAAHPRPRSEGPDPRPGDYDLLPVDPDSPAAKPPPPSPLRNGRILAAIAIGGFAGGLTRYGIGKAVPTAHGAFPAATFGINVSGSFILALLVVFVLEILPPTVYVRPLIGVGFCGALTTFSTWMVDSDKLISAGHYANATLNVLGSLVAGLAATSLGLSVGRAIVAFRRRRAKVRAEGSAA